MKLRNPQLWIAVFSVVAVMTLALVDVGSTMPGPLTTVHDRESELAGRRNCSGCHGGWRETMTTACLECHDVIGMQIEQRDGLHGAVPEEKARKCALCHSEHHGSEFPIVNVQSFVQAAGAGMKEFEHSLVGFVMEGKHLELECKKCHENADVAVLPAGERRFIGLDQDCSLCHEDVHGGSMMLRCSQCHSQTDWHTPASLGHEEHLALVGAHGRLNCLECHERNTARSIENMGAFGLKRAPRQCVNCHESPHDRQFVNLVAKATGMPREASCVACHEPEHTSFAEGTAVMTPEQHALTGFPLEAPHDRVACEDCHADPDEDFAARYPGRRAEECSSCHEDVHGGQFSEGSFAGQECTACHDPLRFEPHAFTVELHERAALPLTGSHVALPCADCHEDPVDGEPRAFRGVPSECEACHADAHDGFFEAFAPDLEPVEHGECARCHLTTDFSTVSSGRFDHALWTGFELTGAHAQADCESCHQPTRDPDETGRTFGRVSDRFGEFTGCVTCHADVHDGRFDGDDMPRRVQGRTDCARCHVETSFRAVSDDFDHLEWTGFPLQGAHRETGCYSCHEPRVRPDSKGRTWGYAVGSLCSDCHQDSHHGQFEEHGRTDCRRCHRVSESFSDLAFNHEIHSRFPLGEAHQKVECSACHPTVLQGEEEFIRYRPLKTGCADCHGEHDRPLLRRKG